MNRLLRAVLTIGCAAEDLDLHATRLAIGGNDSQGGGSATEVDEEDDEKLNEEDDATLNEDEDDTRSSRSRQDRAYDDLKSDRDRIKLDLDRQQEENRKFQERLAAIESEQTARQRTNERTNTALELSEKKAREVVAAMAKIPADDPERAVKIYTEFYKPLYEDIPKQTEEISRRTSRETLDRDQKAERYYEEAKKETLAELEKAGLDPEDFDMVEAIAIQRGVNDPGWTKRVKNEDQIPELVGILKDRIGRNKRGSQEFQEERRNHRKPMDGVIEGNSQNRRSVKDQEEDEPQGKGSILTDMARIRAERSRSTNRMLRHRDDR